MDKFSDSEKQLIYSNIYMINDDNYFERLKDFERDYLDWESYEDYCEFQYNIIKDLSNSTKQLLLAIIKEKDNIDLMDEDSYVCFDIGAFFFNTEKRLILMNYR